MIQLILILICIGVLLYFLDQIPMVDWMRTVIRVVAIICVIFFIVNALGLLSLDIPLPRLRQ